MRFSILHISDVHSDLTDEVDNASLVDSLARDFARYREQPEILVPSLCIATGDLVYGVNPSTSDASSELKRQYDQARDFLVTVSDRLFGGNRERVVILPGNHDVSLAYVIASVELIQIPDTAAEKSQIGRAHV